MAHNSGAIYLKPFVAFSTEALHIPGLFTQTEREYEMYNSS